jgi:phosphate transport system substrate-binding protein
MTKLKNRLLVLTWTLALVASVMFGCSAASTGGSGLSQTITIAGSTTVQPLADKWASDFMNLNKGVTVTVNGGGTGVGITSAYNGSVDIGTASRELTSNDPPLVKYELCRDVIVLVVSPSNKVDGLTKQQVVDIFSGKITNWNQVGGDNKRIDVAAREEGSGTRTAFQDLVMGNAQITNTAILQSSNGALRMVVSTDPNAITFLSVGYVDKSLKSLSIDGILATDTNAQNGTYPIVRGLYFLTKLPATGLVKSFIDYCMGPDGQRIVEEEGYLPLK